MARLDVRCVVQGIYDLPTLPQVVIKLMNAMEDPKMSAQNIGLIMGNDQSLATRVLKLVNSSFYSLPRRITSIRDATVILGFTTIRSLAISASVMENLSTKSISYENFWQQSLGCAFLAEMLKPLSSDAPDDNSFTVGLLHNIGKIVIEQNFQKEFTLILRYAKIQKCSFEEAENHFVDGSHCQVTALLMKRWKLPETMQNAVEWQNTPLEAPPESRKLAAAVYLARYLWRRNGGVDETNFDQITEPAPEIWDLLSLPPIESMEDDITRKIKDAEAIFQTIST